MTHKKKENIVNLYYRIKTTKKPNVGVINMNKRLNFTFKKLKQKK